MRVVAELLKHPVYKVSSLLNNAVAHMYYLAGLQDFCEGDFQTAAKRFFFASTMNLDHEKAGQAYRHAMEGLRNQSPSPLTDEEKHWLNTYYNRAPTETELSSDPESEDNSSRKIRHAI